MRKKNQLLTILICVGFFIACGSSTGARSKANYRTQIKDIPVDQVSDAPTTSSSAAPADNGATAQTFENITVSITADLPINASPTTITVTFNKPVIGFEAADIEITNGSMSNFSGSGTTYTFDLAPAGQGQVTVSVAANVATDAAGNGNSNSHSINLTWDFDSIAPVLTYTSISPQETHWEDNPVLTFSVSENVVATIYSDSGCSTPISSSVALTAGSEKTLTVTGLLPIARSTIYARATDAAGNTSSCTSFVSYTHLRRFHDPNPSTANGFGTIIMVLSSGNVLITSPFADPGGVTDAGAVYLFDGTTGVLISELYGTTEGDKVGGSGVVALTNGNFVVKSRYWDCPSGGAPNCSSLVANVGAVTWGNGTTGITGAVSGANSLIGSSANDQVGWGGVVALTNGNYVVQSPFWDCPSGGVPNCSSLVEDVGAVTWGSGTTGVTGAVSGANSLIGSSAEDSVGTGVVALTNGNYVVLSSWWNCPSGGAPNCSSQVQAAGAATWGSGTVGITGKVSGANSLIGSTANDMVGFSGAFALSNGNFVVTSSWWDCPSGGAPNCSSTVANVGAVTWASGTTGVKGAVKGSNSIIGSTTGDIVGSGGIIALSNGSYMVSSSLWGAPDEPLIFVAPGAAMAAGAL